MHYVYFFITNYTEIAMGVVVLVRTRPTLLFLAELKCDYCKTNHQRLYFTISNGLLSYWTVIVHELKFFISSLHRRKQLTYPYNKEHGLVHFRR